MKNLLYFNYFILFLSVLGTSCKSPDPGTIPIYSENDLSGLVDSNATPQTRALFINLLEYQDSAIMFGHQDDLAYGIGWTSEEFRSDVHDVTGKFPAVFGWDAGEIGTKENIDGVSFDNMSKWMIAVFEKGGINTLSWHLDNPLTGGDSWDTTPAVHAILPGGERHDFYCSLLDVLAEFISGLKTTQGVAVPVIFRPFHEHNGSWFWWGRNNCSVEEYLALFRFTVEYLRDEKGLRNVLYAWSPDRFLSEDEYLERFPGEVYVDILGYDDYWSFADTSKIHEGINALRIISQMAARMNKPFALTESGFESIPQPGWWTDYVLNPIRSDSLARKVSWMLVWRNYNKKHHYAPYPGHPSAENFREFEADPFTWFLEDLPDFYTLKTSQ
ncbi:MAG: beta-mannosidase [Bacteroidales bacterium]|nr:beta-mannosidase [Bacteroidales bacterium]